MRTGNELNNRGLLCWLHDWRKVMHLTEDLLCLLIDGVSRHVDSTCTLSHLGQTDGKVRIWVQEAGRGEREVYKRLSFEFTTDIFIR